jgi:hypothetical protein
MARTRRDGGKEESPMTASWAEWHFSDAGWYCPPDSRFHWYEADYFLVREEHLEVIKSADNHVAVGILREPDGMARPVLVGPNDPDHEGYVWVTDVDKGEWVALKEAEGNIWARPVVIKKRRRKKEWMSL